MKFRTLALAICKVKDNEVLYLTNEFDWSPNPLVASVYEYKLACEALDILSKKSSDIFTAVPIVVEGNTVPEDSEIKPNLSILIYDDKYVISSNEEGYALNEIKDSRDETTMPLIVKDYAFNIVSFANIKLERRFLSRIEASRENLDRLFNDIPDLNHLRVYNNVKSHASGVFVLDMYKEELKIDLDKIKVVPVFVSSTYILESPAMAYHGYFHITK